MDWLNIISNGCIFFTIIMFATGIPQCSQMFRQKSTKNIPFLPYLMTNVNCICWTLYGRLTINNTVVLVNVIGAILQTFYINVFMYYSSSKITELKQCFVAASSLFFGWITGVLILEGDILTYMLGLVSCGITMLMFASPLADIKTVIAKKSTEILSFSLTVASFVCASMWTMFGFLINDFFIMLPNIIGILTSVVRFYLFHKYPSQPSSPLPM